MPQEIKTIPLPLPLRLGSVNCYLIKTSAGFILIDSGPASGRARLLEKLESTGCHPGDLKLLILTHGDFDHTGNAAYLRKKVGGLIAIHAGDSGMLERGDMFSNRKNSNILIKSLAPVLSGFTRSDRCKPDLYLEDGSTLTEYGFDAQVIRIPGHSLGSIGILTDADELFCGDLLENTDQPALNSIMDDKAAATNSIDKLKMFKIGTVYPGHGKPFPFDLFLEKSG